MAETTDQPSPDGLHCQAEASRQCSSEQSLLGPPCWTSGLLPQAFNASASELRRACLHGRREPGARTDNLDAWLRGDSCPECGGVQVARFAVDWCASPWSQSACGSQDFGASTILWSRSRFVDLCTLVLGDALTCETAYLLEGDGGRLMTPATLQDDERVAMFHAEAVRNPFLSSQVVSRQLVDAELERADSPSVRANRRKLTQFPADWLRSAFLVQVPDSQHLSASTRALDASGVHVFVLHYHEMGTSPTSCPVRRCINFSGERLVNLGYTALWLAARRQEEEQGWLYGYYVFFDEPLLFVRGGLDEFQAFLRKWEPAVGGPALDEQWVFLGGAVAMSGMDDIPSSVTGLDMKFIAFHGEAAEELLPFQTRFDFECQLVSEVLQMQIAALKYKGRVLVTDAVVVLDVKTSSAGALSYHGSITPNCWRHIRDARAWFVEKLPSDVQHCAEIVFATPDQEPNYHAHGTTMAPPVLPLGLQRRTSYADWHVEGLGVQTCSYTPPQHGSSGRDDAMAFQHRVHLQPRLDGFGLRALAARAFRPPGSMKCWDALRVIFSAIGEMLLSDEGRDCSDVLRSGPPFDPPALEHTCDPNMHIHENAAARLWEVCCRPVLMGEAEGNEHCWWAGQGAGVNVSVDLCCYTNI